MTPTRVRLRPSASTALAALSILLTAGGSAPAQDSTLSESNSAARRVLEKPTVTSVRAWHEARWVSVKFQDGSPIRAQDGLLEDGGSGALAPALGVLAALGDARWIPLSSLSQPRLVELRAQAQDRLGRGLPDLQSFFHVRLGPTVGVAQACDLLNSLEIVELAKPVQRPARLPGGGTPVPPDWEANQGYLDPAPDGIDARAAWNGAQTRGFGVRILDLEYQFNSLHIELPVITYHNQAQVPTSGGYSPLGSAGQHGTAVLGVLLGKDDDAGIVGIAAEAEGHFIGTVTMQKDGSNLLNIAGALLAAIDVTAPGDVIVIEQQVIGPNHTGTVQDQFGLVPAEWIFEVHVAVLAAVGNGRVVVAAAGNGSQDLDAPEYSTGNDGHWPFLRSNDSGAILVGAGAAPAAFGGQQEARSRLAFSNYGSRLDVQGWGERIWTCGMTGAPVSWDSGTLGVHGAYTSTFGGTSGATPIVAGAAALAQARHRRLHGGAVIEPIELRTLLRDTGTPQAGANPASEHIGPMPDLFEAFHGGGLWVDFAAVGPVQNGSFTQPFATLSQALAAATPGAGVWVKSGASPSPITIQAAVTLGSYGGPVTIGAPGP